VVDAEQPGRGVEHPGRVERDGERQEVAGRVGEAGDRARRVRGRRGRDGGHDAGGADRDDDVARPGVDAQRGRGVVAGARAEHRTAAGDRAGLLGRAEHPGQHRAAAERPLQQVRAVLPGGRGPVAGAAGVTPVGHQRVQPRGPGELPGQPVVRQAHRRGARRVGRFVLGQPAQLGHRERGDRHQPDRVGPRLPAAELRGQVGGRLRGPGVVPQQRVPYDGTVVVQADHAVLLSAHGDGGDVVQATGLADRRPQCGCPGGRVDLGAVGVRRPALTDQGAAVRVAHHDLAGLGRGIDPGHQGHVSGRRAGARSSTGRPA
jgi:hypothetical protein